jgi:hypothetical protein
MGKIADLRNKPKPDTPANVVPPSVMNQLFEDHGKNPNAWNQALQDIFDPSISARQLNAPMSGKVNFVKNTGFVYKWIKDVCGQNPDHTRVESLRGVGWEFADTNDVDMANDFVVKNRKGARGFSNEIRNGDLRLMKCPQLIFRQDEKFKNVAAYQMAYPQAFGKSGQVMTAQDLVPALKTHFINQEQLQEFEGKRVFSEAADDVARVVAGESPLGNTSVHKSKDKE